MRIKSIKNQENQTSFKAKFCIGGDIKSVPKEFIVGWASVTATI